MLLGTVEKYPTQSASLIFLQFLNQQNHKILSSVKDQVETEMIEKVVLYKLKNDVYAQSMPYQEEYAFIEEWMRKYYELPDGVKWNGFLILISRLNP